MSASRPKMGREDPEKSVQSVDSLAESTDCLSQHESTAEDEAFNEFLRQKGSFTMRELLVIYFGLSVGVLTTQLEGNISNAILPTLVSELGALEHIGLVSMATYLINSTVQPTWSKVADVMGRKTSLLSALAVFTLGCCVCGLAPTFAVFMVGVVLEATGSIGVDCMVQIVIADVFPLRHRGKWQSYFEISNVVSAFAGPAIAGAVTGFSWRYSYAILAGMGILSAVPVVWKLRLASVQQMPATETGVQRVRSLVRSFDLVGTALLMMGTVALLLPLKYGGTKMAWDAPLTIGLLVAAGVLLPVFAVYEARFARHPIMPPRVFNNRTATGAFLVNVTLNFASMPLSVYLTLYLQVVKGLSPGFAGSSKAFYTLGAVFSSILSGYLMSWDGKYRRWMHLGIALNTVGVAMTIFFNQSTSAGYIIAMQLIRGLGGGMITCPALIGAQGAVATKDVAITTTTFGFFKAFGAALGTAIFGGVWQNMLSSQFAEQLPPTLDHNQLVSNMKYVLALPPEYLDVVIAIYVDAMRTMAVIGTAMFVLVFASGAMMRPIDLDQDKDDFVVYNDGKEKEKETDDC